MHNKNTFHAKAPNVQRTVLFALGVFAMTLSMSASAQWKWVDSKGITNYTDMPPPISVPQKNILRSPSSTRPARSVNYSNSNAQAGNSVVRSDPSLDRKLEDARQQQENEQLQEENDMERKLQQERQNACAAAQRALKLYSSGLRIRDIDAQGNYYYLDDVQTAQKREAAQQRVDEYCQ